MPVDIFIKTIAGTIRQFHMLSPGDRVLAAVSGGPDSVALLLSLSNLKPELDLSLAVVHVNHQLRGKAASQDEQFVKNLADTMNLDFHGCRADVKDLSKKNRLSIEEAGREARYAFFEETCSRHGYHKIATGHTQDDNAEQVLINLLRGSGPKGLSGIPPVRQEKYIRPLIRTSKHSIIKFLNHCGQAWCEDASNTDRSFLRNRIRHDLIPLLQSDYNPAVKDALNRMSRILQAEESYLDLQVQTAFKACLESSEKNCIIFSKQCLAELHPALQRRVVRKAIERVKGDLKRISHLHLEDITGFFFDRPTGDCLDLPGQIRVYKSKDSVTIKKEDIPLRQLGKSLKKKEPKNT